VLHRRRPRRESRRPEKDAADDLPDGGRLTKAREQGPDAMGGKEQDGEGDEQPGQVGVGEGHLTSAGSARRTPRKRRVDCPPSRAPGPGSVSRPQPRRRLLLSDRSKTRLQAVVPALRAGPATRPRGHHPQV